MLSGQTLIKVSRIDLYSSAYGNRTRVTGVRGRRPRPLDERAIFLSRERTPGGNRTPNPLIRSQMLYPIELRARNNNRSLCWGAGIRTPVPRSRAVCPATGRLPNFLFKSPLFQGGYSITFSVSICRLPYSAASTLFLCPILPSTRKYRERHRIR